MPMNSAYASSWRVADIGHRAAAVRDQAGDVVGRERRRKKE